MIGISKRKWHVKRKICEYVCWYSDPTCLVQQSQLERSRVPLEAEEVESAQVKGYGPHPGHQACVLDAAWRESWPTHWGGRLRRHQNTRGMIFLNSRFSHEFFQRVKFSAHVGLYLHCCPLGRGRGRWEYDGLRPKQCWVFTQCLCVFFVFGCSPNWLVSVHHI